MRGIGKQSRFERPVVSEVVMLERPYSSSSGFDHASATLSTEAKTWGGGCAMSHANARFFANKVMQIASELKYQLPLVATEFQEHGCDCGAKARYPGPCVDCAARELARLIGEDRARHWLEACEEQQSAWKLIQESASAISTLPSINA